MGVVFRLRMQVSGEPGSSQVTRPGEAGPSPMPVIIGSRELI